MEIVQAAKCFAGNLEPRLAAKSKSAKHKSGTVQFFAGVKERT